MKKCSITVNDYTFSFPIDDAMPSNSLKTRVHRTVNTIIDQFDLDIKTADCTYRIED